MHRHNGTQPPPMRDRQSKQALPSPDSYEAYVAHCIAVAEFEARMRVRDWQKPLAPKTQNATADLLKAPNDEPEQKLLTTADVARRIQVSHGTVRRADSDGDLKRCKMPNSRMVRYTEQAVEMWINGRKRLSSQ